MSFLPKNYEQPVATSKYYKFQPGDNKFRILSDAIVGYIDWDNKKPIRTEEKPEKSFNPARPFKHFWTFVIWSYKEKAIKILEVTQATIQSAIMHLTTDENWGDPKGFDLNVIKTGEEKETKYNVVPMPPKPLNTEATRAFTEINVNLRNLFDNKDPFTAKEVQEESNNPLESEEISEEDIPGL